MLDNKKAAIERMKIAQTLEERLMKGEEVACPKCGETLLLYKRSSGYHPGIFCPNGDYKIYLGYKD